MKQVYRRGLAAGRQYVVLSLLLLATGAARAQAPAWSLALAGSTPAGSSSQTRAVATDASGNVFITGYFSGSVTFGSTVLTSAGADDLFVAKYVPATGTWAWATSGGGNSYDRGYGLAVRGSSVYVTGYLTNTTANTNGVVLAGTGSAPGTLTVNGASPYQTHDFLLAKYTDNGTSVSLAWAQVGGGASDDESSGVAVSGSNVYVVGTLKNNATNANGVVFGGNGTAAGTVPVSGTAATAGADLLLAKYLDTGSSATLGWTQVAGGAGSDYGYGVAVGTGPSVYVTGSFTNDTNNTLRVLFGGNGTTVGMGLQYGASSSAGADLLVAKYLDNGSAATVAWTQIAGGGNDDYGYALAVSGPSVYVTGTVTNSSTNARNVLFGGSGATAGTVAQYGASALPSADLLVAKYTDAGASATVAWTQLGGGAGYDCGYGIALSGSSVYVTGSTNNNAANANGVVFGGSGATAGTVPQSGASATASLDLVAAKYLDQGSSANLSWLQVGGGAGGDQGQALAVSGQSVYAAGYASPAATFGGFTLATPVNTPLGVLARLTDTALTPLATASAGLPGSPRLSLYPNPTAGPAAVSGLAAGTTVQVLDALGRPMLMATADATGKAVLTLPLGLAAGLYLVRAGQQAMRLLVQ